MKDIILFTQNTMASIVATRIILNENPEKIKMIVMANLLKGDSVNDQLAAAYKLIKKSSFIFFIYKLIESKVYNLLLLGHKILRTNRYLTDEAKTIEDLAKKYHLPVIAIG